MVIMMLIIRVRKWVVKLKVIMNRERMKKRSKVSKAMMIRIVGCKMRKRMKRSKVMVRAKVGG